MHCRLILSSATAYLQAYGIHQAQALAVREDSMFKLAQRDTTNDLVHDSFFIPGVVSSGVVLLVGIVCVLMILLTSSRPDRPLPALPPTHDHDHDPEIRPVTEVQHNTRPRSYLSRTTTNNSGSGSFYHPTTHSIQRKPAPIFQASPNRTPPGTATLANFPPGGPSSYVHELRPGVPQHPSLAKYNPEPLIYTPPSPKLMAYQWTYPQAQAPPHDPGLPRSPSSMTRVGSGRSEQAADPGASQNPPSPLRQKADQRQLHLATMPSGGSYGASTDHGGIESEEMGIRTHLSSGGEAHGHTRMVEQPPDYVDSGR